MSAALLIDSFAEIEDLRYRNTVYPMVETLLFTICGAINGAEDFGVPEELGKSNLGWHHRLLLCERGILFKMTSTGSISYRNLKMIA